MTTICEGKSLFINRGISEIIRLDLERETWETLLKINQGTLARSCVADDGQVSIHSVDAQEVMILRKGEWIISERLRDPQENPSGRIEIGISAKGNRAIRVLRETAVRCWDLSQEVPVDTEFTLGEPAEKIVLDRDGNRLFVVTQAGSLHAYDIASGELLHSLPGIGLVTAKPVISADGQGMLLVQGQSITRYDIAKNQISWRVQLGWPHPLYYVALSPDGTRLAVCGAAAPIHILDFSTGILLQTLSKAKEQLE
jgi:WD40 repeat protein